MKKLRRFNFFISRDNDNFLKEESERTGQSMAEICEKALNDYRQNSSELQEIRKELNWIKENILKK